VDKTIHGEHLLTFSVAVRHQPLPRASTTKLDFFDFLAAAAISQTTTLHHLLHHTRPTADRRPPASPSTMDRGTQRRNSRRVPPEPEQPLIEVFKAAALSLSKLYTGSVAAQTRARADGYQDCLEDLVALLDREPCDAAKIRRWLAERMEHGRDTSASPHLDESDDESDGPAPPVHSDVMAASPEPQPRVSASLDRSTTASARPEPLHKEMPVHEVQPPQTFAPPSLDNFTFQSPYPDIGDLDLSDSRAAAANVGNGGSISGTPPPTMRRPRHPHFRSSRTGSSVGRVAGSKRKLNMSELFDIGNLGGKDPFGGGGKRGRHA
jgi:hypothetical protein